MEGITLLGCRENNLKNISLTIPYSKIVTFIGVSGSGKSTIAFDTLYAEGKRRYIESLGVNESYFLSKIKKPDADHFIGLPPAIALEQTRTVRNPRSSVGTISQAIYYLQLLFSSCGTDAANIRRQLTPAMFNTNSPSGMCMECGGSGELRHFDETLIWPDQEMSLAEGGLKLGGANPGTTKFNFMDSFLKQYNCSVTTPIKLYPNELKVALLFGQKKNKKIKVEYPGIIPNYEKTYQTTKSLDVREELERYMTKETCSYCYGTGHNADSLKVTIDGKTIADYMKMSIDELFVSLKGIRFGGYQDEIYEHISVKLLLILKNCLDLGIGYLSMNRKATTLSGGELQRLRIVAQISSQISGVVYVLDEPSSGMHMRDIERLIQAIRELNGVGNKNTVVLVEHTPQIILSSDYVFEIGPGAGAAGGNIITQGTPEEICKAPESLSGKYLTGRESPGRRNFRSRFEMERFLEVIGANAHNLQDVCVRIPMNQFVCVTGVSGSGKTSFVFDSLYQSLRYRRAINLHRIIGMELIDRVVLCDQAPIGISSRSCPATYSEAYGRIRMLFASTAEARRLGLAEKHFSFNSPGGRCEKCGGDGCLKINMSFMPEMSVQCDECGGKRFQTRVLEVKYSGLSIADVLELSIQEASEVFAETPSIVEKLRPLETVGLGYLKLGQPTSTLSGGESQRLKLAYELSKVRTKKTLILFDEPSRGLHFEDVRRLLEVMRQLVDRGMSVIAVEHNLDIISSADYVIDLGPGAGEKGGTVCGEGTPLQIAALNTPTGIALKGSF